MLTIKKRKNYPTGNLKAAVSAVKTHRLTISAASREFYVPRKTICDRVKGQGVRKPGPPQMLTDEEERCLVSYMVYMSGQGFPLTRAVTRIFIQSLIRQSGRQTLFNLDTGPSDKWFRAFYARHPELQERKPERQERSRSRMSNVNVMKQYFHLLDKTLINLHLKETPSQIFNVDEIGFSGKETSKQRVTSLKGSHTYQQQMLSGGHITATICVSADGRVLPTAVTFSNSLPHKNYTEGVPSKWLFGVSKTGYVDGELFELWFKHIFLPHCGRERPVLLILDNHDSHVRLEITKLAMENKVELLGLPPHTTHILQPLDVGIFGPLKAQFCSLATKLGFVNSQMTIGKARFPFVLNHAIEQSCPPSRIKDAFVKTGIFPFNPHAIDKTQLVPSSFGAKTQQNAQHPTSSPPVQSCSACGNFLVNPLVASGMIPPYLSTIFVAPKVPAPRKRKNVVTEARVLTGDEIVRTLLEKERKDREREESKKVRREERERKKLLKNAQKDHLLERKKAREERKRQNNERKSRKDMKTVTEHVGEIEENETESDHETVCKECELRDPASGLETKTDWVSCEVCENWFHVVCVGCHDSFECKKCVIED